MLKTSMMDETSLLHMKNRAEELLEKRGVTIHHPLLCEALRSKG